MGKNILKVLQTQDPNRDRFSTVSIILPYIFNPLISTPDRQINAFYVIKASSNEDLRTVLSVAMVAIKVQQTVCFKRQRQKRVEKAVFRERSPSEFQPVLVV